MNASPGKTRVAIWSPYMGNVGTIRAVLNISRGLRDRGWDVDLFRIHREWEGSEKFLRENGIRLVDFGAAKVFPRLPRYKMWFRFSMGLLSLYSIPFLWFYLRRRKPDVLLICLLGFLPMLVLRLSALKPKVILSVQGIPTFNGLRRFLWKHFQSRSDAIVALTENTRRLLLAQGLPAGKLHRINNPIIDEDMRVSSLEPLAHPWFAPKTVPVIVGIGRLSRQKDFPTLIRAFAEVRWQRPCRLLILGEGEDRSKLQAEIDALGVAEDVRLEGFVANPYAYLAASDVFVLSSLWEDPGHVLMEAAFLRVPIIATDCPSGPRDFLDDGALGRLCPMRDAARMASAILAELDSPRGAEELEKTYRKSLQFTAEKTIGQYMELGK